MKKEKKDYNPPTTLQPKPTHPKNEKCPLCEVSEETLKILKEKGKAPKDPPQKNFGGGPTGQAKK